MEESKQVIFNIGPGEYGISILKVKGIERQLEIVPVPNRPSYLLGIVNLRGDIIPVYSLRDKFGYDDEVTDDSQMIITSSNDVTLAFKVDDVKEIVDIPQSKRYDMPEIVMSEDTEYVDKVAKIDKRLVLLLNLNGVLSEEERNNIEAMMQEVE